MRTSSKSPHISGKANLLGSIFGNAFLNSMITVGLIIGDVSINLSKVSYAYFIISLQGLLSYGAFTNSILIFL